MKQYLIMVIASALLSAIATFMTPEKWQKYINAVTGVIIISVIISPVFEFKKIDIFSNYQYTAELDTNSQKIAVKNELEKRVSEDIKSRLKTSLGKEYKVETELQVNENHEILGVEVITVWATDNKEEITKILKEVYSPQKILLKV